MVWDLRAALLRKEEFESARLTDFEFREMVRAIRLVAAEREADVKPILHELADHGLEAALALLGGGQNIEARYHDAKREARRQLIAERGDPTPYRLG